MVMIEAMACGTPVVATPRGSVPEIVRHGETGFVCGDERALAAAVRAAQTIDPARCRAEVEARFSADRMAASYASIYRQVVSSPEPVAGSEPTVVTVDRHRRIHAVAVPDPGQNRRTS